MIAVLEDRKGFMHSMWIPCCKDYITVRDGPPPALWAKNTPVDKFGEMKEPKEINFYFERWLEEGKVSLYRERI